MVLIAGLDGRLLTPLILWLGSIVAGRTCQSNTNMGFPIGPPRYVLFHVDSRFFVSEGWLIVRRVHVESSNLFDERVN